MSFTPVITTLQNPPTPVDIAEAARWEHTRLRRRLLLGIWEQDLKDRLTEHVGSVRREAWGPADLSANPFRSICRELAALYIEPPAIHHDDGPAAIAPLVDSIEQSGLWARAPRFQTMAIGCREFLWRVDYTDGRLHYRAVPPDLVIATADPDRPDMPVGVSELRLRTDPQGRYIWTWDRLDVSDPGNPRYEIRAVDGGENVYGADITETYLGQNYSGDRYPYRKSDGTPILPYVLYHAELSGAGLWDPWEGMEIVEGSLNLGVLGSLYLHTFRDASWPQRYVVGAAPVGGAVQDSDVARRAELVTDPATLLVMEALDREGGPQPQVGQWKAGGDIEAMQDAIDKYATRLALDAGVPPSDVQRMGGTAKSGYAIALSNEGKRIAQRKYAPAFRWGDQQLMEVSATILNRFAGTGVPEDRYNIVYAAIPLSPQELEAQREHVLELLDRGLIDPVEAFRTFHPGLSKEQALHELVSIQRTRALISITTK